jgi:hypothetical protein
MIVEVADSTSAPTFTVADLRRNLRLRSRAYLFASSIRASTSCASSTAVSPVLGISL